MARRILVRLAAIAVGLLPLAAIELTLRMFGPSSPTVAIDPYVDLHQLRPLFELDAKSGNYSIGTERMHLFRPASFSAAKATNAFRVFALGGSTTQGEPYSTETAFPKWLEIRLQAMLPSRQVEVINCGGLSYASYRVAAICREVLQFEPDLIIVYTGQNEFLERRSYANESGRLAATVRLCVENVRTLQLLQTTIQGAAQRSPPADRTELATEVDALLDYEGGLTEYHRNDPWLAGVAKHLAWNVSQIIAACNTAGVPVAFVVPTTNILDCPPMKFEVDPSLDKDTQHAFSQLWEAARSLSASGQTDSSIAMLEKALELDPYHAGCLFLLGRLHYEIKQYEESIKYLTLARDADVCPLRATTEILNTLRSSLHGRDVTVVDAEAFFQHKSPFGLVGDKLLVDHIHPSVAGHQMLGDLIGDQLELAGVVSAEVAAPVRRNSQEEAIKEHLAGIGEEYYHRGKQRLLGLQLWTQGRAKKIRSNQSKD